MIDVRRWLSYPSTITALAIVFGLAAWWWLGGRNHWLQVSEIPIRFHGDFVKIYHEIPGDLLPDENPQDCIRLRLSRDKVTMKTQDAPEWQSYSVIRVYEDQNNTDRIIIHFSKPEGFLHCEELRLTREQNGFYRGHIGEQNGEDIYFPDGLYLSTNDVRQFLVDPN